MQRQVLYKSDTALVIAVGEMRDAFGCVTFRTFFRAQQDRQAAQFGFGEGVLKRAGIPAVHFINLQNHWWLIDDLAPCLAAANAAMAGARRRTGYGASLGGYAALRFSQPLVLDEVLAFSPQYSIDRSKAPFEVNWATEAATLDFSDETMVIRPGCRAHVVYDPRTIDAKHLGLICAANPQADLVPYKVPGGGHRAISSYARLGLVQPVLESIRDGVLDTSSLRQHPAYRP